MATEPERVTIGVLAKRGKEISERRWAATAHYLTNAIPTKVFEIVPLDFEEVDSKVTEQSVDFVLVNPAMYVQLEHTHQISRIATLKFSVSGNDFSTLGTVIFTKANRLPLETSDDLKGHSIAAVNPRSFGGWQIALGRMTNDGINTKSDLKTLRFLGTHDLVVQAVLKGAADFGIIRTGTLEQMEAEGKVSLSDFSILPSKVTDYNFPLLSSSRLYPDWAFAKTNKVSDNLARHVAAALLLMKPEDEAAYRANISGWTIPQNYTAIHQLLQNLKLAPYDKSQAYSLQNMIKDHTPMALTIPLVAILLLIIYFKQRRLKLELAHARRSLVRHSNRINLATEAGQLGIWEWNIEQDVFYCDDRIIKLFDLKGSSNTYAMQDLYDHIHPDDIDKVKHAHRLAIENGSKLDIEYRLLNEQSQTCVLRTAAISRYSKSQNSIIINGVTWDISNHRRLVEQNKKLATLDPLTNAKNRRGFFPLARAEFTRSRRYGSKLCLLMLDIDDFKKINDIHGHSSGDATLISLSDICHSILRSSDLFCRLGGEEFVALLHENTLEQASLVAERLRSEIEKTSVKTDKSFTKYTVSIGISALIESDQTIEDTLHRADKALYKAKRTGKNCVVNDA